VGKAVRGAWLNLPKRFPTLILDAFVVMPNHVHGILMFEDPPAGIAASVHQRPRLFDVIRVFKSTSARAANSRAGTQGSLWQRGYYERVIRDEEEWKRVRVYVERNPQTWSEDVENPRG
jgi:REP element-mobilizing transposase RayT